MKIKMKILCKFTSALFMLLLLTQAQAQENKSVFVFAFAPGSSAFLLDYGNNRAELQRLKDEVTARYDQIYGDTLAVFVKGYCAADFHLAAIRSNRIKSELITAAGMREEFFITNNFRIVIDGKTDISRVEVRIPLPEERLAENIARRKKFGEPVYQYPSDRAKADTPVETGHAPSINAATTEQKSPQDGVDAQGRDVAAPASDAMRQEEKPVDNMQAVEQAAAHSTVDKAGGKLFIRANLLYWLVALPNIGIEYKPTENFGILVNGGWNHFTWNDEYSVVSAYFVQPEIRRYFGESRRWFIGLEGHVGQFNIKLSKDKDGAQGDFYGGGFTGGYRLRLSRIFDMDFSLGLGYTNLKYEKYYRSNGVFVVKENNLKKDFFGPSQAGISLIWKIK
jgi:hypothetical protein